MGPGAARLDVQAPVILGDGGGVEDSVAVLERVALREHVGDELGVDGAVDHDVGDVDVLRPQLARHALRHRAQPVLAGGEGGVAVRPAQARRRAGEQDRPAPARDHVARRLAAEQESAVARHLPHLAEHPRRRLGYREAHVRADVIDGDGDGADLAFDARDERDRFVLLARVDAEAVRPPAPGADALRQRLDPRRVARAPGHDRRVAAARETPRDGAAGRVAGADHQRDFVPLHAAPPRVRVRAPATRPRPATQAPPRAIVRPGRGGAGAVGMGARERSR